MKMKRFEINPYDHAHIEEEMDEKLKGATHVHTMQAPYFQEPFKECHPILVYAFYPDDNKED